LPRDVEPHQVMRALAESRLLRRWLSDEVLALFGLSPDGAYLVVFVSEDQLHDDLYIIEGARQMLPGEVRPYQNRFGGRNE
jgi:uncharacterized protein YndB with AHSA1/START domain